MYVCALYACSAHWGQKRALEPLGLEWWMVVRHHVGAGYQTWVLWGRGRVRWGLGGGCDLDIKRMSEWVHEWMNEWMEKLFNKCKINVHFNKKIFKGVCWGGSLEEQPALLSTEPWPQHCKKKAQVIVPSPICFNTTDMLTLACSTTSNLGAWHKLSCVFPFAPLVTLKQYDTKY